MPQRSLRAWFWVPAAGVAAIAALYIFSIQGTQGPQTFSGKQKVRAQISVTQGKEDAVARELVERLGVLGVHAAAVGRDAGTVTLELTGVKAPKRALDAANVPLPVEVLVIRAEATFDGGAPRPEAVAPSRKELEQVIESRPAQATRRRVIECGPAPERGAERPCAVWDVDPVARLSSEDVAQVHLRADPRTEEPLVVLTLKESGRAALEKLAAEAPGAQLAVVGLGEVLARPTVAAPQGNQWIFSTRTPDATRASAAENAERLEAALRLHPLPEVIKVELEPTR